MHRQVRSYVQTIAKPGILMTELCEQLEDSGGGRGWMSCGCVGRVCGARQGIINRALQA